MKYIKTDWDNPYYNMAFEQYVIDELPYDDYVFFYIHQPSIIIGKHQNTIEEINKEYVEENNITVARRLSGGGAVYHDRGNLNFSFIVGAQRNEVNNFKRFTEPVIKALGKMGINSELSGRNDITIDGKKFSGNAQFYRKNQLLHHGTLLFDSEMSNLSSALKVKELKIKSKGIKSVKSRVTNIKEYLKTDISILEFKEYLLESMAEGNDFEEYVLTEDDLMQIQKLVDTKFSTWQWNWGQSPEFDIQKVDKFTCGIIDIRLNVKNGVIENVKIYGDFFVRKDIEILEKLLVNCQHRKESIYEALHGVDIEDYFYCMDKEEFINFLCGQ